MKDLDKRIRTDESVYENLLDFAAGNIVDQTAVKLVLITGPSGSGKTTTANKLVERLNERGKRTHKISLDDFYLNPDKVPVDENGKKDFESVYSLDVPLVQSCLASLIAGEITELPLYDFNLHRRADKPLIVVPQKDDIFIVEGLHALNPILVDVCSENVFSVFLDCYDDCLNKTRARFLRRLVRDYYHRTSSAEKTFGMWEDVITSESHNIRPYGVTSDVYVNTHFGYETGVFRNDAMRLLSEVPSDSEYRAAAEAVMDSISGVEPIPLSAVPRGSLLREFLPT